MSEIPRHIETPLMKQYYTIKAKHPDAVLLFRVGDFYETFGEDAIRTAEILGITLTRRANGSASFIELAGFPYHALDTYLPKLVRAGQRVDICEQLEDPKLTKNIVKRGITELVTPGVSFNDNVLNHLKRENKDKFEVGLSQVRGHPGTTDWYTMIQITNEDAHIGKGTIYRMKFPFITLDEAVNFKEYLKLKIARFCLSIYKMNGQLDRGELASVPYMPTYEHEWTDEMVAKELGLTEEELKWAINWIPDYYPEDKEKYKNKRIKVK